MTTANRSLEGQVALITGASRGIGAATALAFSDAGAKVVLAARDEQALQQVAKEISGRGGTAIVVPTDVSVPESVARLVDRALDAYGRLDAAVNNAAAGGHAPTPLADIAIADFDKAIEVSLRGVFLSMKYEIPAMLRGGGGAIVNMSSTAARWPVAGVAGYVSAKSALTGLTRTAALDYAASGIRVNALEPGTILTDALDRAGPSAQEHVAATVPVHRLGRPEDVAGAAVWLCGPAAEYITGTTLAIDGGLLAGMPPFGRPDRS
jgi:NAD(P)-dependent dehydrogenase (short-subunit alcohol dehydrogenase family)